MADTPSDQPAIGRRNFLKGVTLGGAVALAGTEARALPNCTRSGFGSVMAVAPANRPCQRPPLIIRKFLLGKGPHRSYYPHGRFD